MPVFEMTFHRTTSRWMLRCRDIGMLFTLGAVQPRRLDLDQTGVGKARAFKGVPGALHLRDKPGPRQFQHRRLGRDVADANAALPANSNSRGVIMRPFFTKPR